ncbi:uncharacterized protein LOC109503781 isoform X2 [Harpegnathos saltator]|uniref:uncharacterized protein LOC109503781 isoform X2 n=1 Tax=Harpegnathos saltator TaxID=610380 RepID=UPI0009490F47|nr:uncharacterized protein LOC109503781 isoform X2 [Harpegnathos saltator]
MEFPENQYYRVNRILLSVVGLWPYDNFKVRRLRFTLTLLILITFSSTQLLTLFNSEYDKIHLLKILSFDLICIACIMKYISFYAVMENVKLLRQYVFDNWRILADEREIEIILRHANIGKYFTLIILTIGYITAFFCILIQYIPIILDIMKPLNVSRPHVFFIEAEYFIDEQKYFHIIAIHINIAICVGSTSVISAETFVLANAFHAFGLFKVTSYRMQQISSGYDSQICTTEKYVIFRNRITAATNMHKRAIKFSELLKESFGPMYLILVSGLIISISINLFYFLQILSTEGNILEIVKCIIFLFLHVIALFAGNYAGQEFINCDTNIYRMICNTQWYNAPLRTQKLILFLIQKTTKCYKVDTVGLFYPSLEGLASGLSMSISYFMVFCSM